MARRGSNKMSQLGIGAMLGLLGGNEESANTFKDAIGKTIAALEITEKELQFTFDDGSKIILFDDGQSCCEHRYMHTDDDIKYYTGSKLLSAETRAGGEVEGDCDVKESEFLIVTTDKGSFTVVNYNEHNGYYGGFSIRCKKG
jgi:hypothetical protein